MILRFRLGDRFEPGAWTLGRHYRWIDAIAILWVAFIVIIFLLPPYKIAGERLAVDDDGEYASFRADPLKGFDLRIGPPGVRGCW